MIATKTLTHDEKKSMLGNVIERHAKNGRKSLMQVLQEAQNIYEIGRASCWERV